MSASSEDFPWPSYYGHFNFFEERMGSHSRVVSFQHLGDGLYGISRRGEEKLIVFICECYAFGVAEYMECIDNFGFLNAVVINSAWCGYSMDVKRHCRDQKVGVFKIGDFMAALNRHDYWNYLNEHEKEHFGK